MGATGEVQQGALCVFKTANNKKSIFMKNGLPINPLLFKMIVLVTCFMLVMLYNKSKAADTTVKKIAVQHTVTKN